MTVESSLSKAVFQGNGTATEFPFTFKVWEASQIQVTLADADGNITDVTGDATVTLNADAGGTVAYTLDGAPLPAACALAITRDMPFVQRVDLVSATRFDPQVIEDALDTATAERQELLERLQRAIAVPATSGQTADEYMAGFREDVNATRDAAASATASALQAAQSAATALAAAAVVPWLVDRIDDITQDSPDGFYYIGSRPDNIANQE